jgi:hypothetical protein
MAAFEFNGPFAYRRGGGGKVAVVRKRLEAEQGRVVGNADRPGLDAPFCPDDERDACARALDELCAKRPLKPPVARR